MTKTKQFGTFLTKCHLIVEELAAGGTIAFATSVLPGLRRTQEEVTGAVDNEEDGRLWKRSAPCRKASCENCKFTMEFL